MNVKMGWAKVTRWMRRLVAGCPVPMLLCSAGVLMLAGVLVRGASGSPYQQGMMIQFGDVIPPVWLMTVLWMLWYFVLGALFAMVTFGGRKDFRTQADKYRGGMLFLSMLFLGFLWYPLFFSAGRTFLAALLLLAVLVLCILTALCYIRVFRVAGIVLLLHAAFLFWLLILNIIIAFRG